MAFGFKPKLLVKVDKAIAAVEKTITKPATINRGRVLLVCPIDEPNKIGNKGKIHGAAIVRIPASTAKNIWSIFIKEG